MEYAKENGKMKTTDGLSGRIKEIRSGIGATQKKVGEMLGISLSHYAKIENNLAGISRSLASRICNLFKVNSDWLLYGKGQKSDKNNAFVRDDARGMKDVEKIVQMVMSEKRLAGLVSRQMNISLARALTIIIHEKMVGAEIQ